MAFYCANLPCPFKKYDKMNQMSLRAISFLTEATSGKQWASGLQSQLQGFNPDIYQATEMG